ncbi:SMI1/KNR4 family protein [Streptomyces indiaensis]|uniref:Knr4/Smi1-like domain-containing protein n=1 Tax=Streptomyces indiaensis TaxID=284033 RepID=A0ABN3E414_9ACTN|nr:SMI1/KNR4 family protein [Streptomyces indiaensis]MCF1645379.1 SMI1/KNR4 family protein [Streptomyces indiaensis]
MDTASFASLVTQVRAEHPKWLDLFEGWVATDEDIALANRTLRTQLPDDYVWFMQNHGGGAFGFVEILPVVAPEPGIDDLLRTNQEGYTPSDFIAIAPVGTGDWWGFTTEAGRCSRSVHFAYHDAPDIEPQHPDFLEFLARTALNPG